LRPARGQHIGADEWVMLAVTDDTMWHRLCRRIRRPDLTENPALASAAGRRQRTDEIEAAIGNWTETLDLT
jgi:crotonobetainyl-CoA:carnitine CoA-transferase CaiB-like acyl-CoA transferase